MIRSSYLYAFFAAFIAIAPVFFPESVITIVNYAGLFGLVSIGLILLTGIGGMTSFGQAAFLGVGAYTSAYLCTRGCCNCSFNCADSWFVNLKACRSLLAIEHDSLGLELVLPCWQSAVSWWSQRH